MIGKSFVSRLTSRRRWLATAVVYGLSLSVRFTSATGEEVDIPPQYAQRTHSLVSIISRESSRLPYQDWDLRSVQPIVFRQRSTGLSAPGCIAP
ncbi:hypothetical protein C2U70_17480 [Bradyrhizobium guangdongense]|nr:hypothetical protein C2U70_17480 [Bradyrhizobium guangdongense]